MADKPVYPSIKKTGTGVETPVVVSKDEAKIIAIEDAKVKAKALEDAKKAEEAKAIEDAKKAEALTEEEAKIKAKVAEEVASETEEDKKAYDELPFIDSLLAVTSEKMNAIVGEYHRGVSTVSPDQSGGVKLNCITGLMKHLQTDKATEADFDYLAHAVCVEKRWFTPSVILEEVYDEDCILFITYIDMVGTGVPAKAPFEACNNFTQVI